MSGTGNKWTPPEPENHARGGLILSKRNRDRREARQRLRQLQARHPAVVLYVGIEADRLRRHAPPDVLARSTTEQCAGCLTPVAVYTPAFEEMRPVAVRAGRELAILCGSCMKEFPEGEARMELHLEDPELRSRLAQWAVEAN
jgi:hypothetical protein